MSFFLIITIALIAGAAVLIAKRQSQRATSRSGRYRSPRAGLNLERPAGFATKTRHRTGGQANTLAGSIFLGVVVVVMTFWVVAAFFLPDGQTPTAMVSETKANAAIPEQFSSLAGSLSPESAAMNSGGPGVMALAALNASIPSQSPESAGRPVGRSGGSLTAAAQSMVPGHDSPLAKVGLLSGQAAAKPSRASGQPAPTARAATSANRNSASAPVSTAVPSSSAASGIVVAASSVAQPAPIASSDPGTSVVGVAPPANAPQPAGSEIPGKPVGASPREFTVHLASFTDQGNAEKYRSKLAAAGENALISQVAMEGRQWYRVMSGRFTSRPAAEAYGTDLKRRGLTAETGPYLIKSLD